jgi:hypothetical protein
MGIAKCSRPCFYLFSILKICFKRKTHIFQRFFLEKICKKLGTTKITGNWGPQRFFYWRIFAKFRPQKYDFALYKGFLMKEIPKLPIFEEFFFKSPDFDTRVTKNMKKDFVLSPLPYVAKFD